MQYKASVPLHWLGTSGWRKIPGLILTPIPPSILFVTYYFVMNLTPQDGVKSVPFTDLGLRTLVLAVFRPHLHSSFLKLDFIEWPRCVRAGHTNHSFGVLGQRNLHAAEKWETHLEFHHLAQSRESCQRRISVNEMRAEIYVLSEAWKCEPLMRQC